MEFTLCETPEETIVQAPAPSLLSCFRTTDGPQSWWTKSVSQFWALSDYMWRSCTTKLHSLEQPLAVLNLNTPLRSAASALSSLPPRRSVCTCRHTISESRTWLSLSPSLGCLLPFHRHVPQMTPWWLSNKSFTVFLQILLLIATSKEVQSIYYAI